MHRGTEYPSKSLSKYALRGRNREQEQDGAAHARLRTLRHKENEKIKKKMSTHASWNKRNLLVTVDM